MLENKEYLEQRNIESRNWQEAKEGMPTMEDAQVNEIGYAVVDLLEEWKTKTEAEEKRRIQQTQQKLKEYLHNIDPNDEQNQHRAQDREAYERLDGPLAREEVINEFRSEVRQILTVAGYYLENDKAPKELREGVYAFIQATIDSSTDLNLIYRNAGFEHNTQNTVLFTTIGELSGAGPVPFYQFSENYDRTQTLQESLEKQQNYGKLIAAFDSYLPAEEIKPQWAHPKKRTLEISDSNWNSRVEKLYNYASHAGASVKTEYRKIDANKPSLRTTTVTLQGADGVDFSLDLDSPKKVANWEKQLSYAVTIEEAQYDDSGDINKEGSVEIPIIDKEGDMACVVVSTRTYTLLKKSLEITKEELSNVSIEIPNASDPPQSVFDLHPSEGFKGDVSDWINYHRVKNALDRGFEMAVSLDDLEKNLVLDAQSTLEDFQLSFIDNFERISRYRFLAEKYMRVAGITVGNSEFDNNYKIFVNEANKKSSRMLKDLYTKASQYFESRDTLALKELLKNADYMIEQELVALYLSTLDISKTNLAQVLEMEEQQVEWNRDISLKESLARASQKLTLSEEEAKGIAVNLFKQFRRQNYTFSTAVEYKKDALNTLSPVNAKLANIKGRLNPDTQPASAYGFETAEQAIAEFFTVTANRLTQEANFITISQNDRVGLDTTNRFIQTTRLRELNQVEENRALHYTINQKAGVFKENTLMLNRLVIMLDTGLRQNDPEITKKIRNELEQAVAAKRPSIATESLLGLFDRHIMQYDAYIAAQERERENQIVEARLIEEE